jgi:hypothetical protein
VRGSHPSACVAAATFVQNKLSLAARIGFNVKTNSGIIRGNVATDGKCRTQQHIALLSSLLSLYKCSCSSKTFQVIEVSYFDEVCS